MSYAAVMHHNYVNGGMSEIIDCYDVVQHAMAAFCVFVERDNSHVSYKLFTGHKKILPKDATLYGQI